MSLSPSDLASASAVALARAIRERRISSLEATEATLARLRTVHEVSNAVVSWDEEALDLARAADAAIAKGIDLGPLAGVPLAHKDMFDRAGRIASWGARIRSGKPATRDATVIDRLKRAGTHQVAALHLTEFAFGPTGHNYVIGHARNPWDPSRITGGSSSGTAASVAAGAIPFGLGSDTAASLRTPAACCGVLSIKPTYPRVSRAGAMPLSACLDTVGVIARHAEDLAAGLQAIAGFDPRDPTTSRRDVPDYALALSRPVSGLRIGVDEALIGEAHPEVQRRLGEVLAILERLGMVRAACRFPDWQTIDFLTQAAQLPDAASAHRAHLATRPDDFGPQVRARLEVGHFVSAIDQQTAERGRGFWLQKVLDETFRAPAIDVAILPVNADPVPTIAELDVAGGPELIQMLARVIKFTRPVNYMGLPTVVLPVPRSGDQMPNGIQLVGWPFSEPVLIAIAAAYQRVVPAEIARRLDRAG
jgi:aspartyl-tRNA(Asn)/glutamyl-tRNA(Gln) amidotransferase subunit A